MTSTNGVLTDDLAVSVSEVFNLLDATTCFGLIVKQAVRILPE